MARPPKLTDAQKEQIRILKIQDEKDYKEIIEHFKISYGIKLNHNDIYKACHEKDDKFPAVHRSNHVTCKPRRKYAKRAVKVKAIEGIQPLNPLDKLIQEAFEIYKQKFLEEVGRICRI
jgi:hypothetical protein